MGLDGFKSWDLAIVKAIKDLNIDNFSAITNNVVINFKNKVEYPNQKGEMTILDYLSVVIKAKNRDSYLQSLFVSKLWGMFSSSRSQAGYMKDIALDILPLLFLRERNEDNLRKQIKLFFKIIDSQPHDVFISKIPLLVNLFQNPFFNNAMELIPYLEKRKNGFDVIGFFKAKEQCYYQKDMLDFFVNYVKENNCPVSVDALYRVCNNINLSAVCHCRGSLEVSWCTYSPKRIQKNIESLLLEKLGLSEDYKKFIPIIVASKQYREWTVKDDRVAKSYSEFIFCNILEFYELENVNKDELFEVLKRLNIPTESYIHLMNKYIIEQAFAKVPSDEDCVVVDTEFKI